MKSGKRWIALQLTALFLLSLLPENVFAAEADKAGQTAENCHTMTEEWFGDHAASGVKITANSTAKKPAQSVSGLLDSYFDSRESSYTDHGEVKRKSAKSALAGDTSAFSDAVEAMEERGEFRITDAEITTLYDDSDVIVHEDGTIAVYVYEWVFYDYDDLSDTYRGTDVSGYGIHHKITLSPAENGYEIVSDEYDASALLGVCTLNDSTKAELEQMNWEPVDTDEEITDALADLISDPGEYVPRKSTFYGLYDPNAVATYADKYVYHSASGKQNYASYYNSAYYNFNSLGGDCANYTSQCIYAGGMPQVVGSKYGTNGWYYKKSNDRSATWTGASQLRDWMAKNRGVKKTASKSSVYKGSPMFTNSGGHATICVGYNSAGEPIINAHNSDQYHTKWSSMSKIDCTVQLTSYRPTNDGKKYLTIQFHTNGGSVSSDTFSKDSGGYVTKNSTRDLTKWELGYGHENGLYNTTSFGLTRSGYSFVGWSRSTDGSGTVFDEDAFYKAETIYPDLSKGSATITLYAIWANNGFLSGLDGVYTLTPKHAQNMRLTVAGNSMASGANIQINQANRSKNQMFRIQHVEGDSSIYTITAISSGMNLTVDGGKGVFNTNVNQQTPQSGTSQLWRISYATNSELYLRPVVDTGLCLDVAGSNTTDNTNVKTYFVLNHEAQKWILTRVKTGPDLTYVPPRDSTCTERGNIPYWTNELDGTNYADEFGEIELSDEEIFLPKLGHAWSEWSISAEATCTASGLKTRTCSRCGETQIRKLDPLGHDYVNGVCTRCGKKQVDKTSLKQALAAAAAIRRDRYTDASVAAFDKAVAGGKAVLADDDAAKKEVDASAKAVRSAIAALKEREEAKPSRATSFRFADVRNQKSFYFEPVYWAYTAKPQITNGVDKMHFGPNMGCTRGHVVTFLWRSAGCPEPASKKNPFKDVKKGTFYYEAVLWAVQNGVTKGTSATTFSPNATCTRGQIVTFLYRFNDSPKSSAKNPFKDVSKSAFYYPAMLWAVENGITNGTSKTTFAPRDTCTRGQVVTFLYRAIRYGAG